MYCAKRILAIGLKKSLSLKIFGKGSYIISVAYGTQIPEIPLQNIKDIENLSGEFTKNINIYEIHEDFPNHKAASEYVENMIAGKHCWECMKIKNFLDCKYNDNKNSI